MVKTGKTAFEESNRAQPIKNCKSAFHMATSYEAPRSTHGPTASMKIKDNDWENDQWLKFSKDFVAVQL